MRLNGDVIQGIDHISDIYHVDMCKTPYLRHVLAQFLNQVRSHRDSYCPVQTVYTGTVPPDQDSEPGVLAKELMASRIVPALFAAVEFGRVLDLSGPGDAQPPPRETEVEAESLPLVIPSTPILQHQQHDQGSENGEDDVCMEDLEMLDSMEKWFHSLLLPFFPLFSWNTFFSFCKTSIFCFPLSPSFPSLSPWCRFCAKQRCDNLPHSLRKIDVVLKLSFFSFIPPRTNNLVLFLNPNMDSQDMPPNPFVLDLSEEPQNFPKGDWDLGSPIPFGGKSERFFDRVFFFRQLWILWYFFFFLEFRDVPRDTRKRSDSQHAELHSNRKNPTKSLHGLSPSNPWGFPYPRATGKETRREMPGPRATGKETRREELGSGATTVHPHFRTGGTGFNDPRRLLGKQIRRSTNRSPTDFWNTVDGTSMPNCWIPHPIESSPKNRQEARRWRPVGSREYWCTRQKTTQAGGFQRGSIGTISSQWSFRCSFQQKQCM